MSVKEWKPCHQLTSPVVWYSPWLNAWTYSVYYLYPHHCPHLQATNTHNRLTRQGEISNNISILCRVMASLPRDHIIDYFFSYSLFRDKLLDNWTQYLEEEWQADGIYTNFEKAFDKVPHNNLISKLGLYGIHEAVVKCARAVLLHRKHRLRVNSECLDGF